MAEDQSMNTSDGAVSEFLCSMGFEIDEKSFKDSFNSFKKFQEAAKGMSGNVSLAFLDMAKSIIKSFVDISKSTYNHLNNIAKRDNEIERFARRMWTTEKSARSFQNALEALGYSDYQDVWRMTGEEYNRFSNLRDFYKTLEAPDQAQENITIFRDISGELKAIRGLSDYFNQWVFSNIDPKILEGIRDFVRNLKQEIVSFIPQFSEEFGSFLSHVLSITGDVIEILTILGKILHFVEFLGLLGEIINLFGKYTEALIRSIKNLLTGGDVWEPWKELLKEDENTLKDKEVQSNISKMSNDILNSYGYQDLLKDYQGSEGNNYGYQNSSLGNVITKSTTNTGDYYINIDAANYSDPYELADVMARKIEEKQREKEIEQEVIKGNSLTKMFGG